MDHAPEGLLSLKQQIYLKRILLKDLIRKEWQIISGMKSIEVLEQTILIRCMYYRFLLEFPPFKMGEKNLENSLQELVLRYPKLRYHVQLY